MRFDLHLRAGINERIEALAAQMQEWEAVSRADTSDSANLLQALQPFTHTTSTRTLTVVGVDGGGDYPALAYSDSFVFVTLAQATHYTADPLCGLKEMMLTPVLAVWVCWLPSPSTTSSWVT